MLKSQASLMQTLQPKIKEIQESSRMTKAAQVKRINGTLQCRKSKIRSPRVLPLVLSSCRFLIALYRAMIAGLKGQGLDALYSFVCSSHNHQHDWLWIFEPLSKKISSLPSWLVQRSIPTSRANWLN